MKPVAFIHNDYQDKFGIPRQSLLTQNESRIVFTPDVHPKESLRGIESYSHLWLIWTFSENLGAPVHPTVRPPRLGGNRRVGVFATRSPYRPNPIGLSSVTLLRVENDALIVGGADLLDGTPILDIKPYLAYTDAHPEASGGFADEHFDDALLVVDEKGILADEPVIKSLLAQDPRPHYQDDPTRVYGFRYGNREVKFIVDGHRVIPIGIEGCDG